MSLLDHPAVDQTTAANSDPLAIPALSQLTPGVGDPAGTLSNVVRLIQEHFQTDVCSIYLIKPDRAHLVLAATVGLRQESVGKVSMKLNEGLTGLAAEQLRPIVVDDAPRHPRFKYFAEAGEEPYRSFVGVPLLDHGVIQGVLVVQTREPRSFSREETTMLVVAANQVAPTVSEARTLEQFIAPAYERIWALARNLWWSWDPGAEALFRELDPVRWHELDHNPIALLSEISMDQLEERSRRHMLHSSLNYTHRRFQEYVKSDETWGAANAGVLRARPVVYFSAEFGLHESLPIYSGGLGILAGDHFKSASDLGVPLVGMGLFYDQGYFRQHLTAEGWQSEDYLEVDVKKLPMELALGRDQPPHYRGPGNAHRAALRTSVAGYGGPKHVVFARFRRRRQCARRSRFDRPSLWRRHAGAHSPGAAVGCWRCARLGSPGDRSRCLAPQRGAQRVCLPRDGPPAHAARRDRL